MNWSQLSSENCPIGRTVEVVGAPWTLLVLREAFKGTRRFSEFKRALGVSGQLLSERLATLVDHQILELVPYREPNQRERREYRLTAKGRDLYPVISALRSWGERYVLDDDGPPVVIEHTGCGGAVGVHLICKHGHDVDTTSVTARPGPGARPIAS